MYEDLGLEAYGDGSALRTRFTNGDMATGRNGVLGVRYPSDLALIRQVRVISVRTRVTNEIVSRRLICLGALRVTRNDQNLEDSQVMGQDRDHRHSRSLLRIFLLAYRRVIMVLYR